MCLTLAIPNTEVKLIYRNTILDWFDEKIRQKDLSGIYNALLKKDTQLLEMEIPGIGVSNKMRYRLKRENNG